MATHLPPGLSPDAVDVVTELSSIITRLRAAQQLSSPGNANATTGATAASGGGGSSGGNKPPTSGANPIPQGGVTGATPLSASVPTPNPQSSNNPTANNNNNTANTGATSSSTANPNPNQSSTSTGSGDKELLSVKDLPFATDNLKHKLQRARAAVRMLGDVRRALAQQEAEARALEERRASQAARLARTQEDGLMFVKAKREESEGVVAMRDMDVDETGGGAGKDGDGNGQTGDGERMVE